MIAEQKFLDKPIKNDLITYYNIGKITCQGDDYTTGCLLNYNYFKNYYKMITIDLSKQQALDADPKAIKQINFTGNLDSIESATLFFISEEAKKLFQIFHREPCEYCSFISL